MSCSPIVYARVCRVDILSSTEYIPLVTVPLVSCLLVASGSGRGSGSVLLVNAVALDITRIRPGRTVCAVAVHTTVEMLECGRAQGHNDSTQHEESHAAFERHLFEDGIGVAFHRQC